MRKIIHLVWIGSEPPGLIKQCVKRCRDVHKGQAEIIFWEELPSEFLDECKDIVSRCELVCQIIDVFRVWVCHKYGGIYLDSDIWIHRAIGDLFDCDLIFTKARKLPLISNGMIGCNEGNKEMRKILDILKNKQQISHFSLGREVLTPFVQNLNKNTRKVIEFSGFFPYGAPGCRKFWQLSPLKRAEDLEAKNPVPYGVHLFKLLGSGKNKTTKPKTNNKSFLFIEVPKTGTTSILKTLGKGYDRTRVSPIKKLFGVVGKSKRHLTAHEIKESIPHEFETMPTLAFIRNPWARMVSEYTWRCNRVGVFRNMTFEDFIKGVKAHSFNKRFRRCQDSRRHLIPQVRFIKDLNGKLIVNYVGKQETLQDDLNRFCDNIGRPRVTIPNKNRTNHKHYSFYYTEETIEIVRQFYYDDIIIGQYEYENIKEKLK